MGNIEINQFINTVLIKNIKYLAKQKKLALGDLEKQIGRSAGYFSKKKGNSSIPVDDIYKIGVQLDISMDALVSFDLEKIDKENLDTIKMIQTLEKNVEGKKDIWEKIDINTINRYFSGEIEPDPELKMFVDAPRQSGEAGRRDSNHSLRPKKYQSYFGNSYLHAEGKEDYHEQKPWFQLKLDDNNKMILTHMYETIHGSDFESEVIELYGCSKVLKKTNQDDINSFKTNYEIKYCPICSSRNTDHWEVDRVINNLYNTIFKHRFDPVVNPEFKNALTQHLLK